MPYWQRGVRVGVLLEVKNLSTQFNTESGVVKAVDGVTYEINEGETLALVGESGCGKSVSALSIMRLIPDPPGKITSGQVIFDGEDLLTLPDADMRNIRGNRIAMIFQEPMTSLNPVLTIGKQILPICYRRELEFFEKAKELLQPFVQKGKKKVLFKP